MISLYKDPKGENIFSNKDTQWKTPYYLSHPNKSGGDVDCGPCQQMQTKSRELKEYVKEVSACLQSVFYSFH